MTLQVGQIIYDLYFGNKKVSSATDGGLIYSDDPNYAANRIDIFSDICKGKILTKLGIQAPSGTRFEASSVGGTGKKTLQVGRTGIFELTENIPIDYLKFIAPAENVIVDYIYQGG